MGLFDGLIIKPDYLGCKTSRPVLVILNSSLPAISINPSVTNNSISSDNRIAPGLMTTLLRRDVKPALSRSSCGSLSFGGNLGNLVTCSCNAPSSLGFAWLPFWLPPFSIW